MTPMPIRQSLLFLAITLTVAVPCRASDPVELFRQAGEAYQKGEWRAALDAYRKVLESGYQSGALYYNIGNCHYKLKSVGEAILNYEKARRLIPGDEDLNFNLALANLRTIDKITPLPRFWLLENLETLLDALPRGLLQWLAFLFYFSAAAALIARILGGQPGFRFRAGALAFGLAFFCVLSTGLLLARDQFAARAEGVVLAESTRAFSGPGGDNLQVFVLHEGTKVRIEQRNAEWVEVLLADGNVGWVRGSDLGEI